MRRQQSSVAANPVLIGAITTLVVVVAVFLSYNANIGLPFVPTTRLVVQLEDGATLVAGNEVREGGFRIGVVEELHLERLPGGRTGAAAVLKLDQAAGGIPRDTVFAVRPRGAIGGKYIELRRGRSEQAFPDGATASVAQSRLPVELDDVLSTFDPPTRAGIRRGLRGAGDGLTGRGPDLNATISALPDLLRTLEPVMANLGDPRTRLDRFVTATADLAAALAPVAGAQARLFTGMADTFDAFSRDPAALRAFVAEGPPTLRVGERALRETRPFLVRSTALMADVRATADALNAALPAVNDGVEEATGPLGRTAGLSTRLGDTLDAGRRLAAAPPTNAGLRGLTATVTTLQPQIRYLGPQVTVCNKVTLWGTIVSDIISGPTDTGTALLGLPQMAEMQDDGVNSMGANEFATGRGAPMATGAQHLHANGADLAVNAQGEARCQLGQFGYPFSGNRNDPTPDGFYRRAVVDPVTAGQEGGRNYGRYDEDGRATALGPERVPPGQTFSVLPGGRAAPEGE